MSRLGRNYDNSKSRNYDSSVRSYNYGNRDPASSSTYGLSSGRNYESRDYDTASGNYSIGSRKFDVNPSYDIGTSRTYDTKPSTYESSLRGYDDALSGSADLKSSRLGSSRYVYISVK